MVQVRMPKMGDGMTEGTILRWLKHEGDTVGVNDTLAEIETDKANVEMPAEDAGTLARIVVQEGQTVPVGEVIAEIAGPADSAAGASGGANGTTELSGQAAGARVNSFPSSDANVIGEAGSAPGNAETHVPEPDARRPNGPQGGKPAPATGPEAERVKASPLARRIAHEQGIDLAQVRGTGGGVGRITQRDVEAFLKQRGTAPQPPPVGAPPAPTARPQAPAPAPAAPVAAGPIAPSVPGEDVEVSKMRKAIARRTVQSKQTIPHFYLVVPVEMDRAMRLLDDLNEGASRETKITVNDLIVKACAVALRTYPDVNVAWTPDDKVRRYSTINIGVAVGTDEGLTIPVITDCGGKTLRQISAAAKALIGKARANTLTPQEMSGSTFSVSNLGMFGVEEFMAIINPPDSCMLAVGAAAKEVVVDDEGAFVARQRMRVTLSCDHRTVDGVLGARFLQEVRRLLESPMQLLA